jgi:hypothetical protein
VLPIATSRFTVSERLPEGWDPTLFGPAEMADVLSGVRGHLSGTRGVNPNEPGDQETVDALWLTDPTDKVKGGGRQVLRCHTTDRRYRIVWARQRPPVAGLLGHTVAGVREITGTTGGE